MSGSRDYEDKSMDPNGDPFDTEYIESITSDPWCTCCKNCANGVFSFCTMPVVTMICIILGFTFGIIASEGSWSEHFNSCYADDEDAEMSSCWPIFFKYPGDLWMTAIKLCITPLIAPLMFLFPAKLNKIGTLGQQVAVLLIFTSSIAALEGLTWVHIFNPGNAVEVTDKASQNSIAANKTNSSNVSEVDVLLAIPKKFVPKNFVSSMAGSDVIGMVMFFLVWGYHFEKCPVEWKTPAYNAAKAFLRATINVLCLIMWATPFAMFSFISYNLMVIDDIGSIMNTVGLYVACQLTAQFFHMFGFYCIFFYTMTGCNPLAFLNRIKMAPYTAFLLSSSAGTLPVTLAANKNEKEINDSVGRGIVEFVVSLGATINMDGTSCGFPVMVLWVDQMGRKMSDGCDAVGVAGSGCEYYTPGMNFGDMLMVCLLAMMSSIGTAPIPNAGLVYVVMLMEAGGIENSALQSFGLGLIYMFDWLVDRVETAQNVTSDSFISKILAHHGAGGKNMLGGSRMCCFSNLGEQLGQTYAEKQTANDDV